MNRIDPLTMGSATAITFSIVFAACAQAVMLFPDGTISFFNAWFHGLDLTLLKPAGGRPLTFSHFIYGLFGVAITSFAVGALFTVVYNLIRPRS